MTEMWKLTSFLGTVGLALLVGAFFAGTHVYSANPLAASLTIDSSASRYLLVVGATLVALQGVLTLLGLIVNFFRPRTARTTYR